MKCAFLGGEDVGFWDNRKTYNGFDHSDAYGILLFLFGCSVLEESAWKMAGSEEAYVAEGLFANPKALIDRQPEFCDEGLDLLEKKLRLCERWASAICVMRKIGVKRPELVFLFSDFAAAGTWQLDKGVALHGKEAIADIINTLAEEGSEELQHLSEIIASDNPTEAASAYGVDWEFKYETEMQRRRARRNAMLSNERKAE